MLNSLTHTTFKLATATPYLVLIMLIASCSTPDIETLSETDQQSFIEITDSTIKPSVETTIEIPLESALETTIETTIETLPETSDETLSKAITESSCVVGEKDCHRFDYSTPVRFLNSVVNYAHKNSMAVPIEILSNLTIDAFIQVESLEHAEGIIGLNPEHIL
ncbi:MAG: hypothetical protein QF535_21210, partial [Anaerolineales bacterium]|nr:hypothetical protein [Anaerolineales bacterium]